MNLKQVVVNGQKLNVGGGSSGSSESLDIYSTEEKRIGTWIDGKPLYRKTYVVSLENSATSVIFETVDNPERFSVHNCYGMIGNDSIGIHHVEGASFLYFKLALYRGSFQMLRISVGSEFSTVLLSGRVEASFEYTKTTD